MQLHLLCLSAIYSTARSYVLNDLRFQVKILHLLYPDLHLSGVFGLESYTQGDLATLSAAGGMQTMAPVRSCMRQDAGGAAKPYTLRCQPTNALLSAPLSGDATAKSVTLRK